MCKILIVTHDPEEAKLLELAFELEDIEVRTLFETKNAPKEIKGANTVLIDITQNTKDDWQMARSILELTNKKTRTVLLLPRGHDAKSLPKGCQNADLVVRRPYELMNMVQNIIIMTK